MRRVKGHPCRADEPRVAWWSVVPVVLVLAAVGWAPGWLVLRAAGFGTRGILPLAPAVSMGVIGLAAVGSSSIGVRWTFLPLTVATALVATAAAVMRRRTPRADGVESQRAGRRTANELSDAAGGVTSRRWSGTEVAAAVAGVGLLLVPVARAMERPDRVQNAWDALFHLAGVQAFLRAGVADPSILGRLADPTNGVTYPFGWHAFAALVPGGLADPLTIISVAAFVPCSVALVIGTMALTHAVLPEVRWAPHLAALLTGSGVAIPLALALHPGLIPNAYGLSLVPGVLAWLIRPSVSGRAAALPLLLAAGGIAIVHPGALLGLCLLALPWLVCIAACQLKDNGWRTPATQYRLIAVGVPLLVALWTLGTHPTALKVVHIQQESPVPFAELARRLVTGDLGEWPAHPVLVVACAAIGAAAMVRRPGGKTLVAAALIIGVAYCCAAAPIEGMASLTRLWFSETRRLAPLVGLTTVPLAALGITVVAQAAGRAARTPGAARIVAGGLGIGGLAVAVLPGPSTTYGLAHLTFDQEIVELPDGSERSPYLTESEEDMLIRLASWLDPDDLVLGSSRSGLGHLAALTGQRVDSPYHSAIDSTAFWIGARLPSLGIDPQVCEVVRSIGARYAYVDNHPLAWPTWSAPRLASFTSDPPASVPPVDEADSAAFYSLELCYPPTDG